MPKFEENLRSVSAKLDPNCACPTRGPGNKEAVPSYPRSKLSTDAFLTTYNRTSIASDTKNQYQLKIKQSTRVLSNFLLELKCFDRRKCGPIFVISLIKVIRIQFKGLVIKMKIIQANKMNFSSI